MKKHLTTILLVLALIVGLSVMLYPSLANFYNSLHQSRAISDYAEAVAQISDDEYDRLLSSAREYNAMLFETAYSLELSDEQLERYKRELNVTGTGIMGYIEIKKLGTFLPIYHGTEESVLQIAIGHIAGTSLPVGGENTHCVLSGHRGLPSARLFTDLDKMQEGDTFTLRTLDEILTYEVESVRTVLPDEAEKLAIEKGRDICTLVTCTPYGINSHRLLVTGHRIEEGYDSSSVKVTGDAIRVKPIIVAPIIASPVLLVLLIMLFRNPDHKSDKKDKNKNKK